MHSLGYVFKITENHPTQPNNCQKITMPGAIEQANVGRDWLDLSDSSDEDEEVLYYEPPAEWLMNGKMANPLRQPDTQTNKHPFKQAAVKDSNSQKEGGVFHVNAKIVSPLKQPNVHLNGKASEANNQSNRDTSRLSFQHTDAERETNKQPHGKVQLAPPRQQSEKTMKPCTKSVRHSDKQRDNQGGSHNKRQADWVPVLEEKRSASVNNLYTYTHPFSVTKKGVPALTVEGRGNRMNWSTTNSEQYGAYHHMDKTYLQHLPQETKDNVAWKKRATLPSSNSEYGNFYMPTVDHGRRRYELIKHPVLPAIGPQTHVAFDPDSRKYKTYLNTPEPRREPESEYPAGARSELRNHPIQNADVHDLEKQRVLNLKEIQEIDVQLLTKDLSAISMRPAVGGAGGYDYVSHPDGVHSVKVGDVTEIGLRVKQKDGAVLNMYARPK